ncbi:MAG: hypothetical protein H7279_03860 [Microbacteriaceae bacterium]|nr:hypothetical protein [Microbacteriaceae bacterium]
MTVLEFLRVALRRWYVFALGLVGILVLTGFLDRTPGVYWAQTDVLFLANPAAVGGNPLQNQTDSVIDFASVIQESIGRGTAHVKLSSPSATLYGAGVTHGYVARLADAGGQWESSFNRAVIEVEVVESSPAGVRQVLDRVVSEIRRETAALQSGSGVTGVYRITVESGASDVSIGYMGNSRGSRYRGLAALGLVGLGVSAVTAVLLDRALARRRRRQVFIPSVADVQVGA